MQWKTTLRGGPYCPAEASRGLSYAGAVGVPPARHRGALSGATVPRLGGHPDPPNRLTLVLLVLRPVVLNSDSIHGVGVAGVRVGWLGWLAFLGGGSLVLPMKVLWYGNVLFLVGPPSGQDIIE